MLRISKRELKWIQGRLKEYIKPFNTGQANREHLHKMENLPTEEKKEYLRKRQEHASRLTGFDWDRVGYSMHYNRPRSNMAWWKNNFDWTFGFKHKIAHSDYAKEVESLERILYTFRSDLDLTWWDMMTDENIDGRSRCQMKINDAGTGICWYGRLDTTPPDIDWGRLSNWKSFATLYTKTWERDYGRPDKLMLKEYNCFVLRFRGDGRRYELDVHGNRVWENSNSMWTTSIYTKGGYEWEEIRIPFYHLFQQFKDLKVRDQTILALEGIWGIRFRIQDDVPGPFKLEIDYLGVAFDHAFRNFHCQHYVNVDSKRGGFNEYHHNDSQSILNHYYHDPYNHILKRTLNQNTDTHVMRLDPTYGMFGDKH